MSPPLLVQLWSCTDLQRIDITLTGALHHTVFLLLQAVLRQHAADQATLSYSGEPIVKWPKRVSSREGPQGEQPAAWRPGD